MRSIGQMRRAKALPYLLATGLLSGFLNGLLGAGGGIPIVFSLSFLLGDSLEDPRDLYANALCVMLPISSVSLVRYAVAGRLVTEDFWLYAIPAALGGITGGFLLGKLKASFIKRLFAALVIYSGVLLIIR